MLRKSIILLSVIILMFIAAVLCACGLENVRTVTPVTTSTTALAGSEPSASGTSASTADDNITIVSDETVAPVTSDVTEPVTDITTPEATAEPITDITTPEATTEPVTAVTTVITTPEVTTKTKTETTTAKTTKKTTEPPKKVVTTNEAGYAVDLSEYEKYINPTGDDWSDDYLVIMNAQKPMPADFESSKEYEKLNKRVTVGTVKSFKKYPYLIFNEVALKAFTALTLEAHEYGIDNLDFTSAYRDYSTQETIFNRNVSNTRKYVCQSCGYVHISKYSYSKCSQCGGKVVKVDITRDEAAAQVATYSCAPGTSEHQTGLSADIIQTSLPSAYNSLIQEFGKTDAGIWLEENCYRFGFVLRFPKDKEDITGIIYEPWHFRFVGRDHATKMHELNMCLEEYIDYLEQTGYFKNN